MVPSFDENEEKIYVAVLIYLAGKIDHQAQTDGQNNNASDWLKKKKCPCWNFSKKIDEVLRIYFYYGLM